MLRVICCALAFTTATAIDASNLRKAASKAKAKTAMDIVSESLKAHAELNRFRRGEPASVSPKQTTGLKFEPMPGMPDPAVNVRSPKEYLGDNSTVQFSEESQLTDLAMLTDAIDKAEEKIKGLKLHVTEKENFLDSLRKRERMLDSDVNLDKEAIQNLLEHIDALDARTNRLKKENQLKELTGLYANYTNSADALKNQADGISTARDALQQRIAMIQGTVQDLKAKEDIDSKMAIEGGEDQLQTYGYAGTLGARGESLQTDINGQMAQMIHQQSVLQQQLAQLGGGANATDTVAPAAAKPAKPAKPAKSAKPAAAAKPAAK